jgi:hypothetical protein
MDIHIFIPQLSDLSQVIHRQNDGNTKTQNSPKSLYSGKIGRKREDVL